MSILVSVLRKLIPHSKNKKKEKEVNEAFMIGNHIFITHLFFFFLLFPWYATAQSFFTFSIRFASSSLVASGRNCIVNLIDLALTRERYPVVLLSVSFWGKALCCQFHKVDLIVTLVSPCLIIVVMEK
ncbi:hypothetical protein BDV25DRAFT_123009 [Aspergillus avenaceus]|uniref:Uncharacterized protein n=1 Tax=Aspergillus avenaceus TaxID=36643 RepID=A0A5N6TTN3_ASPAV|nr:hypothetical protein BDV25DRAFT_123009 [Aspergillus avenaceus]